jgi:hypothetical protein
LRQAYDYWQDQPGNCRQTTPDSLSRLKEKENQTRPSRKHEKLACEGVNLVLTALLHDVRWD